MRSAEVERSETKEEGHKDVSQKSYHRNREMMVDKGEPRERKSLRREIARDEIEQRRRNETATAS